MDLPIIDFHTHILPGMDDGSDSTATSIAMLKAIKCMGVSAVCGTSHYYRNENSIDTFVKRRAASYAELMREIGSVAAGGEELPRLIPASETAYFTGISEMEDAELLKLCIQGTGTLMLEMPFCEWTDFHVNETASLIYDHKLKVVLVHPERFCFCSGNKERLIQLSDMSAALQVNAGSLADIWRRKTAFELLEMTDSPLIGSDCHNMKKRRPNYEQGRKAVERRLGGAFLRRIDETAFRLSGL